MCGSMLNNYTPQQINHTCMAADASGQVAVVQTAGYKVQQADVCKGLNAALDVAVYLSCECRCTQVAHSTAHDAQPLQNRCTLDDRPHTLLNRPQILLNSASHCVAWGQSAYQAEHGSVSEIEGGLQGGQQWLR